MAEPYTPKHQNAGGVTSREGEMARLSKYGAWVMGYLDAIPSTPDDIAQRATLPVFYVVAGLVNLQLRKQACMVGHDTNNRPQYIRCDPNGD